MTRRRSLFANLRYGPVNLISYVYFLLYELLSPYIELFGILTVILAFLVDLINVPFMIVFYLIYAVFGSVLSLTAFFSRIQTIDLNVSFADGMKAILLCLFEVTFLRFVMAFLRATAFRGYQKKKMDWGRIERQRLQ